MQAMNELANASTPTRRQLFSNPNKRKTPNPKHQLTPVPERDLLDEALKLCSIIPSDWDNRVSDSIIPGQIAAAINTAPLNSAASSPAKQPTTQNAKRRYKCNVVGCEKAYVRTSHLQAHQRGHIGDKPYVCDYPRCTKRFARSDKLLRHKRSHKKVTKWNHRTASAQATLDTPAALAAVGWLPAPLENNPASLTPSLVDQCPLELRPLQHYGDRSFMTTSPCSTQYTACIYYYYTYIFSM